MRTYHFSQEETGRTSVVFSSPDIVVTLFHDDQRSYEVGLGIRKKTDSISPAYTFEEIVRSQNVPTNILPSGYTAQTLEYAQRLVQKMAEIMQFYAVPLLKGDQISWARIAEQRQVDCIAYAAETSLNQAKRIADRCWAEKDYKKVAEALEKVRPLLGESDLKKLEYAIHKTKMTNG